jgi:hypothetical protein
MRITVPFWFVWLLLTLMIVASFSEAALFMEHVLSYVLRFSIISFLFMLTSMGMVITTTLRKAVHEGILDEFVAALEIVTQQMIREARQVVVPAAAAAAAAAPAAAAAIPAAAAAPVRRDAQGSTDSEPGNLTDSEDEATLHED